MTNMIIFPVYNCRTIGYTFCYFRYRQIQDKPPQALTNIKKLLPFCKDIKLQYKLARDLGMRDLVTNIEKGDSKSYIQDIVASVT